RVALAPLDPGHDERGGRRHVERLLECADLLIRRYLRGQGAHVLEKLGSPPVVHPPLDIAEAPILPRAHRQLSRLRQWRNRASTSLKVQSPPAAARPSRASRSSRA